MLNRCSIEGHGNIIPAVSQLVEFLGGVIAHHIWSDGCGIGCPVKNHTLEKSSGEINAWTQEVATDELIQLRKAGDGVTGKVLPFCRRPRPLKLEPSV